MFFQHRNRYVMVVVQSAVKRETSERGFYTIFLWRPLKARVLGIFLIFFLMGVRNYKIINLLIRMAAYTHIHGRRCAQ